jgi:hypothetical protein
MSTDKISTAITSVKEKKFSASVSEKIGEVTKEVKVREIENGFLVCVEERGYDKKNNWYSNEKEYYSKTNPLAPKTESEVESVFDKTYNNLKEMM